MNESPNSENGNGHGEMLRITPPNRIVFTKSGNELSGCVEIENIDNKPVTYKIKTTAPEKFRVRPSTGVLSPGADVIVNVVLQQGQQMNTLNREKFLVMCMGLGSDMSTNSQDLAELWKNVSSKNDSVELHRLTCWVAANPDDGRHQNGGAAGDMFGAGYATGGADEHLSHFQQVISQLGDTTHRLEAQVKFNQNLQWISLLLVVLLSVATVYILKAEIKNLSQ